MCVCGVQIFRVCVFVSVCVVCALYGCCVCLCHVWLICVVQHTAAHCNTLYGALCCSVLHCVAVCCSVLQCVAVCCSVFVSFVCCMCRVQILRGHEQMHYLLLLVTTDVI